MTGHQVLNTLKVLKENNLIPVKSTGIYGGRVEIHNYTEIPIIYDFSGEYKEKENKMNWCVKSYNELLEKFNELHNKYLDHNSFGLLDCNFWSINEYCI